MRLKRDGSPGGAANRGPRRHLVPLAIGLLGLAGVWWGADHLVSGLYELWRPRIERPVSRALGHPLRLGPYEGLQPWGLVVGPSRLLPGPKDGSSALVQRLIVSLMPLESLRQGVPVLGLRLEGASAQMRRNALGQYWVLGPQDPVAAAPRLALSIALAEPASVRLEPAGVPVSLGARLDLNLHRRHLDLRGNAGLADRGQLQFVGAGSWARRDWRARLRFQRLALAPLSRLLPWPQVRRLTSTVSGQAGGELRLSGRGLAPRCTGQVRLDDLSLRPPSLAPEALQTGPVNLSCSGTTIAMDRADWRLGTWRGSADLAGPWQHPSASVEAFQAPPAARTLAPEPIRLQAKLDLDGRRGFRLALRDLRVRSGEATARVRGEILPKLDLRTQQLALTPDLWRRTGWGPALMGLGVPVTGVATASGRWDQPRLRAQLVHPRTPLLDRVALDLAWSAGLLTLEDLTGTGLRAHGTLPLSWGRAPVRPGASPRPGGLRWGEVDLALDLRYALARLSPLLGSRLQGQFQASGHLRGPLNQLRPDLALRVESPGAGPLRVWQTWAGSLEARPGGGGNLALTQEGSRGEARITSLLDSHWLPKDVLLVRGQGRLRFQGSPRRYHWDSHDFPLDGLQLALGARGRHQPLDGRLSGKGVLELQPLLIAGKARVTSPSVAGLALQQLTATGRFHDRLYNLTGQALPRGGGQVAVRIRGERGGSFWSRFEGRQLAGPFFEQLAAAWPLWRGQPEHARGRASDLGDLMIDTFGGTIADQLLALDRAKEQLASVEQRLGGRPRVGNLKRLRGLVDADLAIEGPSIQRLNLDLAAKGHLWIDGADQDRALGLEPFVARLEGPLAEGPGRFSLEHLPLSLLVLATPVPGELRGGLSLKGRYRLGGGAPSLELALDLENARYRDEALNLTRGELRLANNGLSGELSFNVGEARNSIDLSGRVPLDPTEEGLQLRLASRGDGLTFLTSLGGDGLLWRKGSADLQLLVRGSLLKPVANGFLRVQNGELMLAGQEVRDLQATVLFDFQALDVEQLQARLGENGSLSAAGRLSLFEPDDQPKQLKIKLQQARFSQPRITALADGDVLVGGTLLRPTFSGEIQLSKGSVNIRPGQLATAVPEKAVPDKAVSASAMAAGAMGAGSALEGASAVRPVSVSQLLEEKWNFQQPLVLLGPEVPSAGAEAVSANVPDLPFLRLDRLRLRLGPDLRVVVPNVLNFNIGGLLTLNGPVDASLRATGVVRLKSGRLGLFTTNFSLDPDAPNVAVFTPSLGLIPYLDVALRTRVSDSLGTAVGGVGTSIYDLNQNRTDSALDQLNLVKVVVKVSGPADRLGESIELRSTPPLSRERLVALIGGNSLAGLAGGNAGAALATVLGQSLLSPIVGTLTDALGQRVSFALYPTYVAPNVEGPLANNRSQRVPSQLVLGSEIGLDLSERFNFSVLAAPNRSDVPPQMTLRYQASDKLGLQGSVDTQGRWKSQLQLFLRF